MKKEMSRVIKISEENVNKILKYQEEHGDILDFC